MDSVLSTNSKSSGKSSKSPLLLKFKYRLTKKKELDLNKPSSNLNQLIIPPDLVIVLASISVCALT